MSILFYGDPHGLWKPLYRACRAQRPDAAIIVGDFDPIGPVRSILSPVIDAGIQVFWIPGNRDVDQPQYYDWLFGSLVDHCIHRHVAHIDGHAVAGLGGIFSSRVWYPRHEMSAPAYATKHDYLRHAKPAERWRHGLPLSMRATLFPDDFSAFAQKRADILVTHEAPTSHPNGFVAIDNLAASLHARLIVHGHHHTSYRAMLSSGIRVVGLSRAEAFILNDGDLK